MALPTATEIRDNLEGYNITTSIMSDTWIINKMNRIVVPFVQNFIRRSVSAEEEITEYHSGTGRDLLLLNRRNINSIVRIELVSGTDIDATINLSSIQLIPEEGTLKVKSGINQYYNYRVFPKGEKNIKVIYKIGGTLPDDIKETIIYLTNIKMLAYIEGRTGGGDINTQGWSRNHGNMGKYTNIRNTLNQDAMAILRRYSTGIVGT